MLRSVKFQLAAALAAGALLGGLTAPCSAAA
jgi:hypothetical protein